MQSPWYVHRPYIQKLQTPQQLEEEMRRLGADETGIRLMLPKGQFVTVKVHQISLKAANILKQEVLACGGEVVLHKEVSMLRKEASDLLIMGTRHQYHQLIKNLKPQPFGLKKLSEDLLRLLQGLEKSQRPRVIQGNCWALAYGRGTLVMGVLNVTPDSFSDGGRWLDLDKAVAHAREMVEQGADMIDVGGESTRPGHQKITAEEEIRRVRPVITRLKEVLPDVPVSIDTYKTPVAHAALEAGADLLNDIWGFKAEPEMAQLAASWQVPVVLMHNRPRERADYQDLMGEVIAELKESVALAHEAGLRDEQIILDPGIGFGKTYKHNLEVMRRLDELVALGFPVLLGASRKSMIGNTLDLPVEERIMGTAATVAYGVAKGCGIMRVHDVKEMVQVCRMMDAMRSEQADGRGEYESSQPSPR